MNENVIEMFPADNYLPEIYRWGIEVIRVIQRLETPFFTSLMKSVTALGTSYFYIPLILFIFWWVDEKRGLRLGILIIVSAWINEFMKDLFKQPRPFNIEPSLGLAHESSYGVPSGHAQMALTFWIPLAAWYSRQKTYSKKILVWALVVLFILLIGFTRLYLGVHFPTDLLAGWALALIVLVIWFIPGPRLASFFSSASFRVQNIAAAAAALMMNGLYPGMYPALFLGFCLGYNLMKKSFPFFACEEPGGNKPGIGVKILRCLVGFAGMALLFIVLRLVLPGSGSIFGEIPVWGEDSPFYEMGRFIRYSLIGFWASAGAPWVFRHMAEAIPGEDDKGS